MKKVPNEFILSEPAKYPVKLGVHVASGLSGFIAGVIVASTIWLAAAYFLNVR